MVSSISTQDDATQWTFNQPRPQNFDLPYGYTNHIFKNHTAGLFSKLMMTCKQFFSKERILVVDHVQYSFSEMDADFHGQKEFPLSLEKLKKNKTKLWVTEQLNSHVMNNHIKNLSEFLKAIYRFDGSGLWLFQREFTYEEYMALVASKNLAVVFLYQCDVKYSDGSFACSHALLKPIAHVWELLLYVFYFGNNLIVVFSDCEDMTSDFLAPPPFPFPNLIKIEFTHYGPIKPQSICSFFNVKFF